MDAAYGISRTRDKKGVIIKQTTLPWVNCIHTMGGGYARTTHSRIPINTTPDGCAFTIRTGYERHAYLNGMTRGGGFYPATGVLEISETVLGTGFAGKSRKANTRNETQGSEV